MVDIQFHNTDRTLVATGARLQQKDSERSKALEEDSDS